MLQLWLIPQWWKNCCFGLVYSFIITIGLQQKEKEIKSEDEQKNWRVNMINSTSLTLLQPEAISRNHVAYGF